MPGTREDHLTMNRESGNRLNLLLIALLVSALASGLISLLSSGSALPPAFTLHLFFALGIMPLILGAMTYFVPVLTRTGAPQTLDFLPALTAFAAGLLLAYALKYSFWLYPVAALFTLAAAFRLSWWMYDRSRKTLGSPHPGLVWYRLAIGFLILALIAILSGGMLTEHWGSARIIHLHLNLIGFVTLTALGTLRVLLPTAAGLTDPHAGRWLNRLWPWLAGGTLLIATGSAINPLLSAIGVLPWLVALVKLGIDLILPNRKQLWLQGGAGFTLCGAVAGLFLSLLAGAAHGLGYIGSPQITAAFFTAFLLPLVTGAATHLLPLWLTGPADRERTSELRTPLCARARTRTLLFLAAGLLSLSGTQWNLLPAIVALSHFLLLALGAVISAKKTAHGIH